MKFELLKDRYDFELDRKDKLTAALALPVGVLTVLGGLTAAMAKSASTIDPILKPFFLACLLLDFVAFTACLWFLVRAYVAQIYTYLPVLADLKKFQDEVQEYSRAMAGGETEAQEDFDRELERRIIAAADANTKSNDRRSGWMHWSRVLLLVVLVFTYLAGLIYIVDQARLFMPPQQAPKPAATQPVSAPPKPSFPENRVIKEGREPGNVPKK